MVKYNVGDKVKIVNNLSGLKNYDYYKGLVAEIIVVYPTSDFPYVLKDHESAGGWKESDLERV